MKVQSASFRKGLRNETTNEMRRKWDEKWKPGRSYMRIYLVRLNLAWALLAAHYYRADLIANFVHKWMQCIPRVDLTIPWRSSCTREQRADLTRKISTHPFSLVFEVELCQFRVLSLYKSHPVAKLKQHQELLHHILEVYLGTMCVCAYVLTKSLASYPNGFSISQPISSIPN